MRVGGGERWGLGVVRGGDWGWLEGERSGLGVVTGGGWGW